MKKKPNPIGPASSGAQDSKKKKATSFTGTSGARKVGKRSHDVHDSRRDNQPKAWARKTKGHQDQKDAVKQGGSVN